MWNGSSVHLQLNFPVFFWSSHGRNGMFLCFIFRYTEEEFDLEIRFVVSSRQSFRIAVFVNLLISWYAVFFAYLGRLRHLIRFSVFCKTAGGLGLWILNFRIGVWWSNTSFKVFEKASHCCSHLSFYCTTECHAMLLMSAKNALLSKSRYFRPVVYLARGTVISTQTRQWWLA